MTNVDLVVAGAGPAGLGAALYATRAGARVALVEASPVQGGLCRTLARDGVRYDLGGHIPFVRDEARLTWMRDLLGSDMHYVPLPVVSTTENGTIQPGRYLDQRPAPQPLADGEIPTPVAGESAAALLERLVPAGFRDARMRRYLEKVDGVCLERIPGERIVRLMRNQAAPNGFWFPRFGIGALMDAMAREARAGGADLRFGTPVSRIRVPDGAFASLELTDGSTLTASRAVLAIPAALATRLLEPAPEPALGEIRMRAAALVFVRIPGAPLTPHAWVQCDDPQVPFSRVMETVRWSPDLVGDNETVLGMECYCHPEDDDPVWSLDDAQLAHRCIEALRSPLGWLDDRPAYTLEVVRLPRAYPLADLDQAAAITSAFAVLGALEGVAHAPGSEVIAAIEAGERAASRLLDRR